MTALRSADKSAATKSDGLPKAAAVENGWSDVTTEVLLPTFQTCPVHCVEEG